MVRRGCGDEGKEEQLGLTRSVLFDTKIAAPTQD